MRCWIDSTLTPLQEIREASWLNKTPYGISGCSELAEGNHEASLSPGLDQQGLTVRATRFPSRQLEGFICSEQQFSDLREKPVNVDYDLKEPSKGEGFWC